MNTPTDLIKFSEEDIYHILYLAKVKGFSVDELSQRFCISIESLNDLISGQVRRDCYEKFTQIEKYLVESS
ncbi:hypothetical protein [Planococcus sp. SSTMD024]|uniref:hypothetical protein n=1 Tax=Planococcus sp. SSTMD024 TaxID=3242163 RepID=UPI00351E91F6